MFRWPRLRDAFLAGAPERYAVTFRRNSSDRIAASSAWRFGNSVNPARSARIDRQFRLVPRGYPAGMHEQGVVKQRIGRADGEQGWAQPLQVRIEGRYRAPGDPATAGRKAL